MSAFPDLPLVETAEWMTRAQCRDTPEPDAWFGASHAERALAKRICRTCEVRSDCLDHAIAHEEDHGIWGGLDAADRRTGPGPGAGDVPGSEAA